MNLKQLLNLHSREKSHFTLLYFLHIKLLASFLEKKWNSWPTTCHTRGRITFSTKMCDVISVYIKNKFSRNWSILTSIILVVWNAVNINIKAKPMTRTFHIPTSTAILPRKLSTMFLPYPPKVGIALPCIWYSEQFGTVHATSFIKRPNSTKGLVDFG